MKKSQSTTKFFSVIVFLAALVAAPVAFAGDWGVHVSPNGWGFHYGDGHSNIHIDTAPRPVYRPAPYPYYSTYTPVPQYPRQYYGPGPGPYYPRYNPVVRRDVQQGGVIAPDGTAHGETRVEDRHASYYSPGRNEAITAPETTVTRRLGPDGVWRSVEHTRWIGADGKPHSTTVEQDTVQDIWGNTHTDTNVTLKSVQGAAPQPAGQSGSGDQQPSGAKNPQQSKKQK